MYQGLGYIVVIILFSFSYNILKFFEFKTVYFQHVSNDTDLCLMESNILSNESLADSRLTDRSDSKQEDLKISIHIHSWTVELQFTELRKHPVYINSYICCQAFFMGMYR